MRPSDGLKNASGSTRSIKALSAGWAAPTIERTIKRNLWNGMESAFRPTPITFRPLMGWVQFMPSWETTTRPPNNLRGAWIWIPSIASVWTRWGTCTYSGGTTMGLLSATWSASRSTRSTGLPITDWATSTWRRGRKRRPKSGITRRWRLSSDLPSYLISRLAIIVPP